MESIHDIEKRMNQYIAQREKLDVKAVYERLKDTYDLVLTNTFSLENGEKDYDDDYVILCGESSVGKFQLYDCGLHIIFDVDFADGTWTHWHPADLEESVRDVVQFMRGEGKYFL